MINIADTKKLLLQVLDIKGFKIKKDKSTNKHLVVSDGKDTLVIKRGLSGDYDYYFSLTQDGDYGDTIHFLCKTMFGKGGLRDVTRDEYLLIEDEIGRCDSTVVIDTTRSHTSGQSDRFDISKYNCEFINSYTTIPPNINNFLRRRSIDICNIKDDEIQGSLALLKHDKGFSNLLFLWRDINGKIVGGQYKYYISTVSSCVKKFLPESERSNSLWYTNTSKPSGIFVSEDPLDCLAHREMNKDKNYLYLATGGSITETQISMVHQLANKHNCNIVLGNDNDIMGWKYNFKIVNNDENINIGIDKKTNTVTTTNIITKEYGCYTINQFIMLTKEKAKEKDITIEIPCNNDWNNDLSNLKQKGADITLAQKQFNESEILIDPLYGAEIITLSR